MGNPLTIYCKSGKFAVKNFLSLVVSGVLTPYTTNITGKIQTWRPNTNNSIIQIRKTKHNPKCYIIITCKE